MWTEILLYVVMCNITPADFFNFSEQIEKLTAHHGKPSSLASIFHSASRSICFLDKYTSCFENLGCISTTEEWYHHTYRPKNLEPLDRHTIKTEFHFITKPSDTTGTLKFDLVNTKNGSDLSFSECGKHPNLIVLIHDFTSNGRTGWIKHIASTLLQSSSPSIISVDWQAGAEPPFEQAVSNARVVALEAISLLKSLKGSNQRVYLIGHGLGAHIAGYVGHSHAVDKITGLDPTGPYFEHMPAVVRLDESDAKFVEVLHTDGFSGRSQGTQTSMGHVDFFINGAEHQPHCNDTSSFPPLHKLDRNSLKEGDILPACSHKRSFKYFIEAANQEDCEYIGFQCNSYEEFQEGKCTECEREHGTCAKFGPNEVESDKKPSNYFLHTAGTSPYCMYSYRVEMVFDDRSGTSQQNGNFEMIMIGENGILTTAYASNCGSPASFKAASPYVMIYYAKPPVVTHIIEVRLKWIHNGNAICFFCKTSMYVNKVNIQQVSMKNPKTVENYMCPKYSSEIKSGSYITFTECEGAKHQGHKSF
uniref:Lipase domain-containing protein n=1 Tax=Photinus pyralis TaxID=7054 RepID=A0A1Y1L6B6_PHOPY